MKEFADVSVREFMTYKEMTPHNNEEIATPYLQIVECNSIHSHCLLMPYSKQNNYFVLQIKHPDEWANEFFEIP